VILTGNHFVLDVLAGIAVALVGLLAADAVDRHWRRPRAHLRLARGT